MLRASGHKIALSQSYRQSFAQNHLAWEAPYLHQRFSPFIIQQPYGQSDWKSRAVIVCDGADAFWGVEFDPAAAIFLNLEFNGEA